MKISSQDPNFSKKEGHFAENFMEFPDPQTDCWGEQNRMGCLFPMIDECFVKSGVV